MDRRKKRTRSNIRKAFLELIQKKSINEITITELSELADIDRKTFYLHYETIIDVLLEIESEVADKVSELLDTIQPFSLKEFLRGLNQIMEADRPFYEKISKDTSFLFLKEQCKNILKQALIKKFSEKAKVHKQKLDIYAEYVASGIIGIYTNWLSSDSAITLNSLTDITSNAVNYGWKEITNY